MPSAARALSPSPALCGSGSASTLPAVQAAGSISSASTTKPHTPTAPAVLLCQHLADGRGDHRAHRAGRRHDAQHRAAHATGTGRDAAASASALPVQAMAAPMPRPRPAPRRQPAGGGQQHQAQDVQQRAAHHQPPHAQPHRPGAGQRLQQAPGPLAQAYAGHQFGGFSPQLGDGRALLLGEVIDRHGRRRDIAFKGSGRTPFSRGGDGKAAVGPMLREVLIGEAMHALGIPTTRALAVVATGEPVCASGRCPARC
jgi:hypothetical protein